MGQIWFNFERCAATCRGEEIGPEIVAHEVGHAMGLWHHGDRGIMNPFVTSATCSSRDFNEREREHSSVLYSRSPGNTDPDWDRPTTLTVVSGGTPPTVICYRR